ncbi:neutral zinc metallopeptidase [Mesobacillus zeae]|uniref:neutral zinc metallopeptidase n=1 Tax=Mesobacillus zeae TaxID=1917180 RepID=UPI001FE729ED|nr:neutral zinc metallopeptidase [Mesobacillus zeae]
MKPDGAWAEGGCCSGGIGGVVILLIVTLLGGDPGELLNSMQGTTRTDTTAPYQETAWEKGRAEFVSVVLADTEEVWTRISKEKGMVYKEPTLVLYTGSVQFACGSASSAVGPFFLCIYAFGSEIQLRRKKLC